MAKKSDMKTVPDSVKSFIAGAERTPNTIPYNTMPDDKPWEAAHVREDMVKIFNLRLSEPYWLKLQFIAKYSRKYSRRSMQTFCLETLQPAIDAELEDLYRQRGDRTAPNVT